MNRLLACLTAALLLAAPLQLPAQDTAAETAAERATGSATTRDPAAAAQAPAAGEATADSGTAAAPDTAAAPARASETRWVTDQFEITLRSGPSLQNEILVMLQSGEAVRVLDRNPASGYSLVESSDGRRGYVLSRFLIAEPAAQQQLDTLRAEHETLDRRARSQAEELAELRAALERERADNETLKSTLLASEQELSDVRAVAADTLSIDEQNKHLQTLVNQLRREQEQLTASVAELSDSTRLDWFVRGGAVSLIAFLVGILVTRIRWKKRDSWGSY